MTESQTESTSIDVVFWDFGGVFTPGPFGKAAAAFAADAGLTPHQLEDLVFGYHTPDGDHPWHKVERGEVPISEAFAAVTARLAESNLDFHLQDFFKVMSPINTSADGPARARPEVLQTVVDMRTLGIKNVIITNNVKEFAEGWKSMLDIDLFDHVIDSSVEGVRKPDPAIYQLALDRAGASDPARTAFLDDFEGNIVGAAALGINAIRVADDPSSALDALRALVGR